MGVLSSLGAFASSSGGGALLGAGIGGLGAIHSAKIQGDYNSREAEYNRYFQQKMSNTAYQRAARDLEKAGLNRILALGNPASTPGGSAASMSMPNIGGAATAGATAGAGVGSAIQAVSESKEREQFIQKQSELLVQQIRSATTEADKNEVIRGLYKAFQPLIDRAAEKLQTDFSDPNFNFQDIVREAIKAGVMSIFTVGEGIVSGAGDATGVPDLLSRSRGFLTDLFMGIQQAMNATSPQEAMEAFKNEF